MTPPDVERREAYTIWVCPECGAWAGSDYLGRGSPPKCKRKALGRFPSCSAVMEPLQVVPAQPEGLREAVEDLLRAAEPHASHDARVANAMDDARAALSELPSSERPYNPITDWEPDERGSETPQGEDE